jgi:hypothetical protein
MADYNRFIQRIREAEIKEQEKINSQVIKNKEVMPIPILAQK